MDPEEADDAAPPPPPPPGDVEDDDDDDRPSTMVQNRRKNHNHLPSPDRESELGTMSQKREKHRINSHQIIHFPKSEGVTKVSERANE